MKLQIIISSKIISNYCKFIDLINININYLNLIE